MSVCIDYPGIHGAVVCVLFEMRYCVCNNVFDEYILFKMINCFGQICDNILHLMKIKAFDHYAQKIWLVWAIDNARIVKLFLI